MSNGTLLLSIVLFLLSLVVEVFPFTVASGRVSITVTRNHCAHLHRPIHIVLLMALSSSDERSSRRRSWPFIKTPPGKVEAQHIGNYGSIYEIQFLKRASLTEKARPGERTKWFEQELGALLNAGDASKRADAECILCLHRFKVWWMRPVFVQGDKSMIPAETVMILYRDLDSNEFRLVLPNAGSALQQGNPESESIILTCDQDTADIYCGIGPDPYALMEDGVRMLTGRGCDTGENHSTNDYSFLGLGWCTWNAFYTQITGEKFVSAARELKARNIPIKWAILDDGWQHTTNDDAVNGEQWSQRLMSLAESASKFGTTSLKDAITQVRDLGLTNVWAWHTLSGYWLGLNPSEGSDALPEASISFPSFPGGIIDNDSSICKEASISNGVGIAEAPDTFIDKYHSFLEKCGISGVKVDAQAVVAICKRLNPLNDDGTSASLSSALHFSLSKSTQQRFAGDGGSAQIIHCMAHDSSIYYQLPSLYPNQVPLMRASDDHYPENPSSHGPHIVACAFNSLLLGHLSVPDWDMFTTSMEDKNFVLLHTVARCISGGPVYISDAPKDIQKDIIDKVACADGTVLACRDVAKPILSCLLQDPLAVDSPCLILFNHNGRKAKASSTVFAVFNLCGSGEWDYEMLDYAPVKTSRIRRMSATLRLKDQFFGLANEFSPKAQFLIISSLTEKKVEEVGVDMVYDTVELGYCECDFISLIPILSTTDADMVPIGFRGMINGAGCIVETFISNPLSMVITVRGCGCFVLAIRSKDIPIETITVNMMLDDEELHFPPIAPQCPKSSAERDIVDLGYKLFEFEVPTCGDTSIVSSPTQDIYVCITKAK